MSKTKQSHILVTGGAGYIGTHTCVELLEQGYELVVVDNLSNSCEYALDRVDKAAGRGVTYIWADVTDFHAMDSVMESFNIEAVVHFAALKSVGESVVNPLAYYENNVAGTISVLRAMAKNNIKKFIFSSSATVYDPKGKMPLKENSPLGPINPYGQTKLMTEKILHDLYASDPTWNITILRYFNPAGAHKSGLIGEDPNDTPNNLVPIITRVAGGRMEEMTVFGKDYPTHDGTGVRDYIHIVDLANGHVAALKKMTEPGVHIFNLGTGKGYSVLDVIKAFEKASSKKIPYKTVGRRKGDAAESYADPSKAKEQLAWQTKFGIEEMCSTAWQWQKKNPLGFKRPQ